MVNGSLAPVVELDSYPLSKWGRGNNRTAELHGHGFEPLDQPSRARWPDRSLPKPVLNWTGEAPNQVGPRHNLAYAGGTNVRGCVQELGNSGLQAELNRPGD